MNNSAYIITDGEFKVNDGYFKTEEEAEKHKGPNEKVEHVRTSYLPTCGMMWRRYDKEA